MISNSGLTHLGSILLYLMYFHGHLRDDKFTRIEAIEPKCVNSILNIKLIHLGLEAFIQYIKYLRPARQSSIIAFKVNSVMLLFNCFAELLI